MRRHLCRAALFAVSLGLVCPRGAAFAYLADGSIYSPVNYFVFLPPDAGGSYIDPTFGTAIKRISNALGTPNAAHIGNLRAIVHEYSTMSPFNSDNSKVLIQHESYFALYDGEGNYIRDLPLDVNAASEPRWSRRDPNVFYYVNGNELRQHNVATETSSAVRTFPEYSRITGAGESDICFDGNHFVLVGDGRDIFVYEISSDRKGPILDAAVSPAGFDQVYITPNDNVLVGWYERGTGRFQGVELYDRNMNFVRQVAPAIGHMDVSRDVNGDEVLLLANAADPVPVCQNGVVKIRLVDAQQTCLISFDWSLAFHVSAPDNAGWFFVSTYTPGDPDPLVGSWTKYTNEILQVMLDGSEVRRLAHHRSRPFNDYWYTPRAAVSRDGSRLLYSSNYGLQAILGYHPEYSDVYLIDLSFAAPSVVGSEASLGSRVEENDFAVSYTGSWHPNTAPFHSGESAVLAMEAGARATFTFTETAVRWIGYRDEWGGMARVYVDGTLRAIVDMYASSHGAQVVLYTIGGLPPGTHTLTIEATGWANPASKGAWVWVDAFEVTPRFEQDDFAVDYSGRVSSIGPWYRNEAPLHSAGSAALAMEPGTRVTFHFTGTAVSWIGYRDEWSGIAHVYIDGTFRAEIDTYASPYQAQDVIYTLSGLQPGPHTVTIEATRRKNPKSGGAWVWVDAFEISP